MLRALIAFAGFDRPAPVPLPPKRRTPAPVVAKKPSPVSDTKRVVSAPMSDYDRRSRTKPNTVAEAVVAMGIVHARSNAYRSFTSDKPADLDRKARSILGDELHSYCRALVYAGLKMPATVRDREHDESYNRHFRVNLELDSVSDIDTWERAMDAHSALSTTHHRAQLPLPAPLTIPEAILLAIAARQAERAERLARREGGGGRAGKGGPARPAGATTDAQEANDEGASSAMKGGGKKRRRDDDEDGGGFVPPPPAGPRR